MPYVVYVCKMCVCEKQPQLLVFTNWFRIGGGHGQSTRLNILGTSRIFSDDAFFRFVLITPQLEKSGSLFVFFSRSL